MGTVSSLPNSFQTLLRTFARPFSGTDSNPRLSLNIPSGLLKQAVIQHLTPTAGTQSKAGLQYMHLPLLLSAGITGVGHRSQLGLFRDKFSIL